jgi:hypothetical protein
MFTASVVVSSYNTTISSCDMYSEKGKESKLLNVVSYGIFTFLLPLLLITVSNVITLVTICTRKKISQERTSQQRSTRKTTRIVVSISIMHCISTCPYAIYMYWALYNPLVEIWQFYEYIFISYFLNSEYNFVLYCLFGKGKISKKPFQDCSSLVGYGMSVFVEMTLLDLIRIVRNKGI